MKTLISFVAATLITFSGCHKTSVIQMAAGAWQLTERVTSVGNSGLITTTPSSDSSVILILNVNGTYTSNLNGQTVCQGSYSISTDRYNAQTLQLNNFVPTGIFSLFTLYEIGSNGQVLSSYNGMGITISNNTLTLSSPLTPGGNEFYTFIKR